MESHADETHLKTATLFTKAPISNVDESGGDPDIIIVIGSNGSKILFSCTWNEKRKKDMDDVRSAYGSSEMNGTEEDESPSF